MNDQGQATIKYRFSLSCWSDVFGVFEEELSRNYDQNSPFAAHRARECANEAGFEVRYRSTTGTGTAYSLLYKYSTVDLEQGPVNTSRCRYICIVIAFLGVEFDITSTL